MNARKDLHLALFFTRGVSLETWEAGGMLQREVALYRFLRPHLRRITFVTYGRGGEARFRSILEGIDLLWNRWGLPEPWYVRLLTRFYPIRWNGRTILKSNQIPGAEVPLRIAKRFGMKFIARCGYLYSENMANRHGQASSEARDARILEREVFSGADRIVVTTPSIREAVVNRYVIPTDRIWIIPNYVDTDLFRPSGDQQGRSRRICFIGRLEDEKNPFALLEAIRGIDVELWIVGAGPLEGKLKEQSGIQGGNVRFLGNVPHPRIPEILNGCAAFVLPSRYEGHPKALLEAMSCGLPVIGTDVPGIREVLVHRETGYLCGNTPEGIQEAIQTVLGDSGLCHRMGRNAREFVVARFDLRRVLEMEIRMLEGLAEEKGTMGPPPEVRAREG